MIKELKELRHTFGHDDTAINLHAIRVYEHHGTRYSLDKTLDGAPPFFSLYQHPKHGGFALMQPMKVSGQEYWGDGLSWKAVEEIADIVINANTS